MSLKADFALDYLLNKISQEEFEQVFPEVLQRLPARQWTVVVQKVVEEMHRRKGVVLPSNFGKLGPDAITNARARGERLLPL